MKTQNNTAAAVLYHTDLETLDIYNRPHDGETMEQFKQRRTSNGRKLMTYYARTMSRILQEADPNNWTRTKAMRAAELRIDMERADTFLIKFLYSMRTSLVTHTDEEYMETMVCDYLLDAGELMTEEGRTPEQKQWTKIKEQIEQEQAATTEEEKEEARERAYYDWSGGYYNEADFFASLI